MNKRGFTLIELLAVIAILAILVIIAIPNILKLFNQARRNVFETEIREIYKAAQSEWMKDSLFKSEAKTYSRINGSACGEELTLSGNDNIDYIIKLTVAGDITYFRAGNKYFQYLYQGDTGLKLEDVGDTSINNNYFINVSDVKNRGVYAFSCIGGTPFATFTYADYLFDDSNYGDTAVTMRGGEVNSKMKILANPGVTGVIADYADTNITAILRSTTPPSDNNKTEINTISAENSAHKAYIWYDSGKIYWWTESGTLTLNQDSAHLFYNMKNLVDISSLQYFDTSKVRTIFAAFYYTKIADLNPIRNWDVSKVENMVYTFCYDYELSNLEPLSNWNVSNVKNFFSTFRQMSNLVDASPLSGWDLSSATDISFMFHSSPKLSSLEFARNWNVSKVEKAEYFIANNTTITSLEPLSGWNTSNFTSIGSMFRNCKAVTSLAGLENWDVSNVINFSEGNDGDNSHTEGAFENMIALANASAINDWELKPDAFYGYMFRGTPVHPEFTKLSGTWNNGTFIVNN